MSDTCAVRYSALECVAGNVCRALCLRPGQEAALAEAMLFYLPFLIATATGSLLGVGAVPSIPLSSFK